MQQTLLFIPHEWFSGRLLIGWLILSALVLIWSLFRNGWSAETANYLPVIGLGALIIYFVLPQLEVYGINPEDPAGTLVKQGLAVRGYGVCLLFAIVAGVGITLSRCRVAGVDPDQILSLAFWMTISGILGARCLYVIQKSDEFWKTGASVSETVISIVDMTKGGLVVYGSLIGGILAALVFFRVTKLSMLKTADLIAPGMVLGLAIGRIGCLMNGCCYGGVCDVDGLPGLRFPAGSPPYMQQLAYGDLLGLKTIENTDKSSDDWIRTVTAVDPDGVAGQLGVTAGDAITIYTPDSMQTQFYQQHPERWNVGKELVLVLDSQRQGQMNVPLSQLSARSLKVHPTQIYSSINAFLLCSVLWFFWTVRRFDGEVFALMLILYSIARFLLEIIRRDESGLFGTDLTISQWVSVGAVTVGVVLLGVVRSQKPIAVPQTTDFS